MAKELQEQILSDMRRWQEIEDGTLASVSHIMAKIENPLVRMVMAIIAQDSQTHRKVQQMIIDSMEKEALVLTPEDLEAVSDAISKHVQLEGKAINIAEEALSHIKGKAMPLQQSLIEYLLADEQKHAAMLDALEGVKRGMYPYGS